MLTPQNGLPISGFQLPLFWETNSFGVLGLPLAVGLLKAPLLKQAILEVPDLGILVLADRPLFYDQIAIGLGV